MRHASPICNGLQALCLAMMFVIASYVFPLFVGVGRLLALAVHPTLQHSAAECSAMSKNAACLPTCESRKEPQNEPCLLRDSLRIWLIHADTARCHPQRLLCCRACTARHPDRHSKASMEDAFFIAVAIVAVPVANSSDIVFIVEPFLHMFCICYVV